MATIKTPRKTARKLKPAKPANRQAGKPGNPGPALVQSMRSLEHHVQTGTVSELKQTTHVVPAAAINSPSPAPGQPGFAASVASRLALIKQLQIDAFCPAQQAQIDLGGGTLAHVLVLGEHTTDTGSVFACLPIDVSPTVENIQWRTREDIIWAKRPAVADDTAPEPALEHTVRQLEREWHDPAAVASRSKVMRDKIMAAGIAVQRYDAAKSELREAVQGLAHRSADVASAEHVINSGKFDALCRRMLLADVILRHRLSALT